MLHNPEIARDVDFRQRLDAKLDQLEDRIKDVLDRVDNSNVYIAEALNRYRLLGTCRGVSEALVVYARDAERIDRERLRQARF